jgi:hypothetical protein
MEAAGQWGLYWGLSVTVQCACVGVELEAAEKKYQSKKYGMFRYDRRKAIVKTERIFLERRKLLS